MEPWTLTWNPALDFEISQVSYEISIYIYIYIVFMSTYIPYFDYLGCI